MPSSPRTGNSQSGFTLIELMVTLAIFSIVGATIIGAVNLAQMRNATETAHLDVTQEAREMADQFVRDLHQAGYPTQFMYASNPASSSNLMAMRLVAISETDIWFEGDVDGDGDVDSVRYAMCTGGSGSGSTCPWANSSAAIFTPTGVSSISGSLPACPCTLKRSQIVKANGTVPTQQPPTFFTEVQNIANTTSQPLFLAYDGSGNPVTIPPDLQSAGNQVAGTTTTTLSNIKIVRINLNVLSAYKDGQTENSPGVYLTTTGRVGQ